MTKNKYNDITRSDCSEIAWQKRQQIEEMLDGVERRHGVYVLLAIENGSRAYGFASALSDYDVRFIYHHSPGWYVSAFSQRDNISLAPVHDIDAAGWDIAKFIRLLYRGNATTYEWLNSPIIYRCDTEKLRILQSLAGKVFNPEATFRHYLALATKRFNDSRENPKKFLHLLRSLLSAKYIAEKHSPPPMSFEALVQEYLTPALRRDADKVLREKICVGMAEEKSTPDTTLDVVSSVLWHFAETCVNELASTTFQCRREGDSEVFDDAMRAVIGIHSDN
ncbi:hypothetical protein TDB9533_02638 [Thalassocella blandensis]|nr:hypothetical protein TDB9533_02638 [Thalassocella blandensis]